MLPWLPPHVVELEFWGSKAGDIVAGTAIDLLISERFKAIVEEHTLTGFEGFDPVKVVRVRRTKGFKGKVPRYYRINVVLTQAAVDQRRSCVEWATGPVCPVCRQGMGLKRWKHVILEPGTWTGEDIFEARGLPVTYIATERFKDVCEEYNVANAVFIPAEEYGHDFYPGAEPPQFD